jgi:ComF family protein
MRSRLFEGGSAFAGAQFSESSCAPACSGIYACGVYAAAFKAALVEYKFQGQLWMGKSFGELMYQMLTENGVLDDCECITYIPISDKRFAERGFDQSEVVARNVAERAEIKCVSLLRRDRQGGTQSKFNRKERLENSVNRFCLNESVVNGIGFDRNKTVLLIDDILTTGATMQESALILKANGWEKIVGAVIATGRKDI